MRHGFRTRVWRELPFSARRAILGTFRTVDRVEEWIEETWRSLHHSPAWLFVAVVGTVGIALTFLLFFTLSQELMAAGSQRPRAIIEPEVAVISSPDAIDSRLCLDDAPKPLPHYAAEFAFADDRAWAQVEPRPAVRNRTPKKTTQVVEDVGFLEERPPPRTASRVEPVVDDTNPFTNFEPRVPAGKPDLQPQVQFLRQPSAPRGARVQLLGRSTAETNQTIEVDLTRHRPDGWSLHAARVGTVSAAPQRYAGESDEFAGGVIGAKATDDDAFADAGAWGQRAEIAFQVELHAPQNAAPSQPGQSSLIVRNTGSEMIRRLQVIEPLQPLDVVTAALPGGQVQDDVLLREIQRLRTGRERTLSLDWFPVSRGRRQHEARIVAEAFVAATVDISAAADDTQEPMPVESVPEIPPSPIRERKPRQPAPINVEPVREPAGDVEPAPEITEPPTSETPRSRRRPGVECAVRGGGTVRVGEVAEVTVDIRNSGGTILHNVRISVDLPATLQHRHGSKLESVVERLSPGKSHAAVLRVVGGQPGKAVAGIRVEADEPVNATAAAQLAVVGGTVQPSRPRASTSQRIDPRHDPCCGCDCGPQVLWIGAAF